MEKPSSFLRRHRKILLAVSAIAVAIIITAVYVIPAYESYTHRTKIYYEVHNDISRNSIPEYSHTLAGGVALNMTPQLSVVALYLHPTGKIYFPALQLSLAPPGGEPVDFYWITNVSPTSWAIVNETPHYFGFEIQYESTAGNYLAYVYNTTSSSTISIWISPPPSKNLANSTLSISYLLGTGTINYTFPEDTPTPIYMHA